jgi:methionyl-tRNA formyltransferase
MTKLPNLVFFGSGPVGQAALRGLIKDGFSIEAIITKPRSERHHGSMPVEDFAKEYTIPYFTPATKRELTALFDGHDFISTLGVVVDYGIIISHEVIASFKFGIVNSHFSLLPQWRGADPITFLILS